MARGRLIFGMFFLGFCFGAQAEPIDDVMAALTRGNYTAAIDLLRSLLDQRDPGAMAIMGRMYETGSGVPKDDSKAADWYLKSLEVPPNGRFHAEPIETLVAQLYRDARGVSQSYADAAKWYRKAAERGFAPAQEGLACLYIKGHGVPQDFVLAYMWLNLAATGTSDEDILGRRDALAALMTPDQVAEAQKMTREWKPAR
jgi:hypothetical protein